MARIILGVSGGIAAYKSADLASTLAQRGDEVRAVLTPNALQFITALTFRAVTRQPAYVDQFGDVTSYRPDHIGLPEWADVIVIAPATASLIARLAAGLGDDLLTVTVLACDSPVLVAPAMNDRMWANSIVRENVEKLRRHGFHFIDPGKGHLACGSYGAGRLAEPEDIVAAIDALLPAGDS